MKRDVCLLWLAWIILLYGFQWVVTARVQLDLPDRAVSWSADEAVSSNNANNIYLNEPFLFRQLAWDSEYYVSIAVAGYDDPAAGTVAHPVTGQVTRKNYSFLPLYPLVMRSVAFPLTRMGWSAIGAAALAGALVALLGALAGMLALWHLTRDIFDADSGWRAVFYLLIFPAGFFLAQVYTEGLFIGLAFWSLVCLKQRRWVWAAVLGVLATWTRAQGAALSLAFVLAWGMSLSWKPDLRSRVTPRQALVGALALLPLGAFVVWRLSPLGAEWAELQSFYYARGLMIVESSAESWRRAFAYARDAGGQGAVYFGVEVLTILVALVGSAWLVRRDLVVASFSLAVIVLSVFSGSAQSMARYMLVAPALFISLGHFGRHRLFDRAWTIASLLLMSLSVLLFSFDRWVG